VNGYLMDTNHVTAWEEKSPALIAKIESLPKNTLIYTSAVTLGEISAGHEMTAPGDAQRRHLVKQFLNLYIIPYAVSVTHATESYYGQIIGRIWKGTPPPKATISTDAYLVSLGVNINDVWIVACAWEHGLILLTADNMSAIRNVTPEVSFENWC
jgi:predicted nucleic acid-binding protein